MKNAILSIATLFTLSLTAQESCMSFFPSEKGKTYVTHHYNKKDKLTATVESKVIDNSGEKLTVQSTSKTNKNKELATGEMTISCENGQMKLSPEVIFHNLDLRQYQDMEYNISGSGLIFPNTLEVGQKLPDGDVTISVDMGGMNMKTSVFMQDRIVKSQEKITTPAGSFDCYLITYTQVLKTMGINQSFKMNDWVAKGIGIVKQEMRNNNGKLGSKSILEQIK